MALMAVTGAAGHVGANLVRVLLAEGHTVRVLVHRDDRALRGLPTLQVVRGSLQDRAALGSLVEGAEVVFHLAAQIAIGGPEEALVESVNVAGTRQLVEVCEQLRPRRLVHFSSVHALAQRHDGQPLDELGPLVQEGQTAGAYDRSKARAQRLVQEAVDRGLDAVILYPTAIVGPHDHRPSAMGQVLLDLFAGRLPAVVEGGFNWVDVRDVAGAALAAAGRGTAGESYIVAGAWMSLMALARRAAALTGCRAPLVEVPMVVARPAAALVGRISRALGLPSRFTPESMKALREHRLIRHDRATLRLGYQPRSIDETLRDTFTWFQDAGLLGPTGPRAATGVPAA